MGSTLWILEENQEGDSWDHTELLQRHKELDTLCATLGIAKLSSYFDESVMAEDFDMDVAPKYYAASDIEKLMHTLVDNIEKNDNNSFLLGEIEDIISKSTLAKKKNIKVRLALIP